jgi:D-alanine-D-alanine ligase-like ATP-grasp enzyme
VSAAPAPTVFEDVIPSLGARLGLTVHVDPERPGSGQIVTRNGRRLHFRDTQVDLNGACAAAVAADRERMAFYLLRMGYPVPDGRVFHFDPRSRRRISAASLEAGYRYAREALGWPVVVKAKQAGSAAGAAVVGTRREYERATREVVRASGGDAALVQRKVDGHRYHVLVLDGAVLAACERLPLSVIGDGRRTIGALLDAERAALITRRRDRVSAPRDYRVEMRLRRIGATWDTVPAAGESVVLLETGSSSTEAVDLTERIHPEYRALAGRLARDAGLRSCGIEIISPDSLADPVREYTVIGLDAAAPLDHLSSTEDESPRKVEAIVERMLRAATLG